MGSRLFKGLFRNFWRKQSCHHPKKNDDLELSSSSGSKLPRFDFDLIGSDWFFVEIADFLFDSLNNNQPLVPDMSEESEILNEKACMSLCEHLPFRVRSSPWTLVYSTSKHGFGLKNLYRKLRTIETPTLVVIKDLKDHVFGAITSCAPRVSRTFFGNGESAVFSCSPELKIYKWNDERNYNIVKGDSDCIAVGCGSGASAIWLDEDLFRGRTQACTTFANEPLCQCGDFTVKTVEVWCFDD